MRRPERARAKCGPLPIYLTSPRDFSLKALIPFSVREKIRAEKKGWAGLRCTWRKDEEFSHKIHHLPVWNWGEEGKVCVPFFRLNFVVGNKRTHIVTASDTVLYQPCLAESTYSTCSPWEWERDRSKEGESIFFSKIGGNIHVPTREKGSGHEKKHLRTSCVASSHDFCEFYF